MPHNPSEHVTKARRIGLFHPERLDVLVMRIESLTSRCYLSQSDHSPQSFLSITRLHTLIYSSATPYACASVVSGQYSLGRLGGSIKFYLSWPVFRICFNSLFNAFPPHFRPLPALHIPSFRRGFDK